MLQQPWISKKVPEKMRESLQPSALKFLLIVKARGMCRGHRGLGEAAGCALGPSKS